MLSEKECYLQFRFFDHITKFPIDILKELNNRRNFRNYGEGNVPLNMLRVHYFFSLGKDVNAMLKDMIIDIRITEGDSWDKVLFSGKSLSLHDFVSDYCSLQTIILPKCVSLFTPDIGQHMSLQVFYI